MGCCIIMKPKMYSATDLRNQSKGRFSLAWKVSNKTDDDLALLSGVRLFREQLYCRAARDLYIICMLRRFLE